MPTPPFTIGGAIKEGWELTKKHLGFLIVYQIILLILIGAFGGLMDSHPVAHTIGWIIIALASMGFYNSALLITSGITPTYDELYKNWRLLVSWIVAHLLFEILFIVGFILLVIPAFYFLARFGLYPFFILNKDLGPIESFNYASLASEGVRWPLFLLFLACIGLNILGALFFIVGLFITVPVTLLALASVFRKLTNVQDTTTIPISEV